MQAGPQPRRVQRRGARGYHTIPVNASASRWFPVYPRFGDFRRVRAQVDPEDRFGNPYLNRVLGPAA